MRLVTRIFSVWLTVAAVLFCIVGSGGSCYSFLWWWWWWWRHMTGADGGGSSRGKWAITFLWWPGSHSHSHSHPSRFIPQFSVSYFSRLPSFLPAASFYPIHPSSLSKLSPMSLLPSFTSFTSFFPQHFSSLRSLQVIFFSSFPHILHPILHPFLYRLLFTLSSSLI